MPIVRSADAIPYEIHGARFLSHAATRTGSRRLAAWTTRIPPGTDGVPHTVSDEEILRLVEGRLRVRLDGETTEMSPGDVAIVPAGTTLAVDNPGAGPATMWVTAPLGLRATMADGTELTPPWAA